MAALTKNPPGEWSLGRYALVSLDIDNFNYVNDLFGYKVGNEVLRRFAAHLSVSLSGGEYFCHLHADHFLLWLNECRPRTAVQQVEKISDLRGLMDDLLPDHYHLVCSAGVVYAENDEENFSTLMDKANFARKRAKGNCGSTCMCYSRELDDEMKWRKTVTLLMDSALANHEFEMFIQPKVFIKTGQVVGGEALVRWNSKTYGRITPDRFIPIMEQNGFIRQLDFFMLNQACRHIQAAMQRGEAVLPISVNFSKAHLQNPHFVEAIFQTVNSYGVPAQFIEVEITESVFSADFQTLVNAASALRFLGFKVTLDDFGSAYSSLNCLKDLPLDVIKIDKIFLDSTADTSKGRAIVAKVVELIKSLRMVPVIEGVEDKEQVEFLKKLSCDIGQGYFFAKPLPAEEYTEFIHSSQLLQLPARQNVPDENDAKPYAIPEEFQLDNWELYTLGKNIDIGLMKNYLGEDSPIQYINDKALEYLGYTREEVMENFQNNFDGFIHPDDATIMQQNARELAITGKPLQFRVRAIRKDGKVLFLQGRASCVIDGKGHPVGLYAFQDVTEELERSEHYRHSMERKITELESALEALRISEERYRLIVEQSSDIMFDWDFETDRILFSQKYKHLFGYEPICHDMRTNTDIRRRIHPEDREAFERWVIATYRRPSRVQAEFRVAAAGGNFIQISGHSTPIFHSEGRPIRAVGVFTPLPNLYSS